MSAISTFAPRDALTRGLFAVELRKLVNTRVSAVLVGGMLLVLTLMSIAIVTTGGTEHLSFQNVWGMLNLPMSYLLPVLAILLVTSEWSQRTAIATFTLEPRRGRVIGAKLATSLALTLAVFLATAVFAAVGTWLAMAFRSGAPGWELDGAVARNLAVLQFARILEGFAFGLLIRSSAVAVTAFLAIPTAWTILGSLLPRATDHIQPWVDFVAAETPFQNGEAPFQSAHAISGAEWTHLAVSVGIWVVAPLVFGAWRVLRTDVK